MQLLRDELAHPRREHGLGHHLVVQALSELEPDPRHREVERGFHVHGDHALLEPPRELELGAAVRGLDEEHVAFRHRLDHAVDDVALQVALVALNR